MGKINYYLRKIVNNINRRKLKNKDFTLISSNCNGCLICHDLNIKFNSPFVNLYLEPRDFIKYLNNMDYYNNARLMFINDKNKNYPVGVLGDIKLYFVHYDSEEQAEKKWYERVKRINLNNLFILMTDRDGCTEEILKEFDRLPYKNKVIFTHLPNNDIGSAKYIKGFETEKEVGMCFQFKGRFTGKKYYDDFDYVKWFNEGRN